MKRKKKRTTTLTCPPWEVGLKDEGNQTIKRDFFVCTQMFPSFLCLCRLLHVDMINVLCWILAEKEEDENEMLTAGACTPLIS
jgi:hypothetical protein